MKYILPILSLLFFCMACGDNPFETTLNVDPPPHEDRLVLHGFAKSTDSLIAFSVGQSFNILGQSNDGGDGGYIDDAIVEIYEDGNLKYELEPTGSYPTNYKLELDAPFGTPGKTYEVKLKHSMLSEASATQVMPTPPTLISATFEENGGFAGEDGERANAIDLVIDDPAGEDNYYEAIVWYIQDPASSYYYNDYAESIDANSSPGMHDYVLIDGTGFDGEQYNIQLEMYEEYTDSLFVTVHAITEDWYLYSKSMKAFREGDEFNLFTEPVTVHSNMENGLGVFALGSKATIKVED